MMLVQGATQKWKECEMPFNGPMGLSGKVGR